LSGISYSFAKKALFIVRVIVETRYDSLTKQIFGLGFAEFTDRTEGLNPLEGKNEACKIISRLESEQYSYFI